MKNGDANIVFKKNLKQNNKNAKTKDLLENLGDRRTRMRRNPPRVRI